MTALHAPATWRAQEVDQLVDQFDLNESGVIDVEEFLKLYTSIMGEDPACTLNDGDPISNYGTDSMPRWFDDDGPEINGDITGSDAPRAQDLVMALCIVIV